MICFPRLSSGFKDCRFSIAYGRVRYDDAGTVVADSVMVTIEQRGNALSNPKQSSIKLVWHQISIIERFSSVLYPFDVLELLRMLPNLAYVVPELVARGMPEPGRALATKGDIELALNQDNKILGVRGRDTGATILAFQDLRRFCFEQLAPSPGLTTHYLEFDGQGWAESGSNPLETLARFWGSFRPLGELAKLVETEVTNYGVQLTPPKDPNDPSWFHIYIEPLVASSNSRYRIRYIWRGPDVDEMLGKFAEVDDTLKRLISIIEG